MRNRRIPASAVLLAVLAAAFIGPPVQAEVEPAPASSLSTAAQSIDDCLTFNAAGEQEWFGGPGARANALGDALMQVVENHRDQATGVAFCTHYDGVVIFVASSGDGVQPAIAKVAAQHPGFKVITRHVAAPLNELLSASMKLFTNSPAKGLLTGGGPDIYTGGLTIEVAPDHWPLTVHDRQIITDSVNAGRTSPLPLTLREGGYIVNADAGTAS